MTCEAFHDRLVSLVSLLITTSLSCLYCGQATSLTNVGKGKWWKSIANIRTYGCGTCSAAQNRFQSALHSSLVLWSDSKIHIESVTSIMCRNERRRNGAIAVDLTVLVCCVYRYKNKQALRVCSGSHPVCGVGNGSQRSCCCAGCVYL